MKLVGTIILYGALAISLFFLWDKVLRPPCSRIVEYDVGVFDERFGMSKEFFISYLQRAEIPWEKESNKQLFTYTPGADFKVNLIWSDEQERLYKGNDLEENLDSVQESIDSLQGRYESAVFRYERATQDYESQLATYEQEVTYWNNNGGAPEKEYAALQKRVTALDKKASEIKRLLTQVNKLAEDNNQRVKNYNSGVEEYNNLFDHGSEFDAGNTDGTEINVYTYNGNQELHTLLVHEFGHVLGIDHIDDEKSVMHYLLNDQNKKGTLSAYDIAALQTSCRL